MIEYSVTGASNSSQSVSRFSSHAPLVRTLVALIVLSAIFSFGCKSSNGQERSGGSKSAGKSGGAGEPLRSLP